MLNIYFQKDQDQIRNIIIGIKEDKNLEHCKNLLPADALEKINLAIENFSFKEYESETIKFPSENMESVNVFSIPSKKLCTSKIADTMCDIISKLKKATDISCIIPLETDIIAEVLEIIKLKSWKFDKYKSSRTDAKSLCCISNGDEIETKFSERDNIISGVFLAKELISEPANVITPNSFEEYANELTNIGIGVQIVDSKYFEKNKMGGILSVGQGSEIPPRIIILKYIGDNSNDKSTVLVGKGITFDSGGLNLKPSQAIYDMKTDMSGAAAVIGTLKAVALNKLKKNVIGILGLAENLPSGHSYKPGDIITMMNGMTVEVGDTDAEGRLVLADCLTYAQKNFKIDEIIDLATLTGACVIALGYRFAGLFSNSDELKTKLLNSAKNTKESLWELPMCDFFDKAIDSDIADIKNIAKPGTGAGSSTAAHFLKRFIEESTIWSHIDIAGVAFTKDNTPVSSKGATGFGVRLLYDYLKNK